MQINITSFFKECSSMDYSASVAEIGANAGHTTWTNACEDSADYLILNSEEKLDAFRAWLKPWGAWNEEEISAFSDIELNALLLQWIAGDMRESGLDIDQSDNGWQEYETLSSNGQCQSNLFRDENGNVFFSLEH